MGGPYLGWERPRERVSTCVQIARKGPVPVSLVS
jgi:hypothetical protein